MSHWRVRWVPVVLASVLLFAYPGAYRGYGAAGDLDGRFGASGVALFGPLGQDVIADAIAVQSDGKLVVTGAGGTDKCALGRLWPNGAVDSSFGAGGTIATPLGGTCRAMAIQSDGKIVAVGYSDDFRPRRFAIVRYQPNGVLDPNFGSGGVVTLSIGDGDHEATAVSLQDDGRILVAGLAGFGLVQDFTVVRLLANGSPDGAFGSNGVSHTAIPGWPINQATAMATQANDLIILAGSVGNGSTGDSGLVRYTPDGNLDATFGSGGVVTSSLSGSWDSPYAVKVQPDGAIVTAGFSRESGRDEVAVVRYRPDGSLDPMFGSSGVVKTDLGSVLAQANDLTIQADGSLVVAGIVQTFQSILDTKIVVLRYSSQGVLDLDFGTGGIASAEQCCTGATAVALDGSRIVVAGGSYPASPSRFVVARFLGSSGSDCETPNGAEPDADHDSVCIFDDNCSDIYNPSQNDIDHDFRGDACDAQDASLNLNIVRLKRTSGGQPHGSIGLKGDLLTTPPADAFSVSTGMGIRVQDGLSLDHQSIWGPSECSMSVSGRVKCRSADGSRKATFQPIPSAPALYRFAIKLTRLNIAAPFQPPVTVTVADGGLVVGVDRMGQVSSGCVNTNAGMTCR